MKKQLQKKPKKIVFDLDGVLCTQTKGDYENAKPINKAITLINKLHDAGHKITIHTARFMGRCSDNPVKAKKMGYIFTKNQLASWGIKYHKLILGKPSADLLIDDRAIFFSPDWSRIEKHIETKLKK
jgi:hypothetical protein